MCLMVNPYFIKIASRLGDCTNSPGQFCLIKQRSLYCIELK